MIIVCPSLCSIVIACTSAMMLPIHSCNASSQHSCNASSQHDTVMPNKTLTVFLIIICRGVVSAEALRLFLRPLRRLCGFMLEFYFTSRSTSILRPIRSQFYVQFDLNFTSNSTSILRPIRPQFFCGLMFV